MPVPPDASSLELWRKPVCSFLHAARKVGHPDAAIPLFFLAGVEGNKVGGLDLTGLSSAQRSGASAASAASGSRLQHFNIASQHKQLPSLHGIMTPSHSQHNQSPTSGVSADKPVLCNSPISSSRTLNLEDNNAKPWIPLSTQGLLQKAKQQVHRVPPAAAKSLAVSSHDDDPDWGSNLSAKKWASSKNKRKGPAAVSEPYSAAEHRGTSKRACNKSALARAPPEHEANHEGLTATIRLTAASTAPKDILPELYETTLQDLPPELEGMHVYKELEVNQGVVYFGLTAKTIHKTLLPELADEKWREAHLAQSLHANVQLNHEEVSICSPPATSFSIFSTISPSSSPKHFASTPAAFWLLAQQLGLSPRWLLSNLSSAQLKERCMGVIDMIVTKCKGRTWENYCSKIRDIVKDMVENRDIYYAATPSEYVDKYGELAHSTAGSLHT
ncbi:hypothetical protein CEUSTIGMA_g5547.t1 [Chlamydomonas eustigma]|uniref:Uncharacterized protein n=1 Tax=Chlamydomonas eustigma TaxID=1157962 RepID=A0A250X4V0_9CHLO|nr:hypothetical protein CEUSTIGMA_g5547.t1 [Chlamydomonas eustigma]|eukprot:GAX78105.1 hypothetical protein CEUSTIGMA_g5547.t1 [Chlamydomonas eustigma]